MKRIECVNKAKEILQSNNIPDWEQSIRIITSISIGAYPNTSVFPDELTDSQVKTFYKLIHMRSRHVPIDKIIGYTEFFDLVFPFNKNVLTPRQETEILVEGVVKDIKVLEKSADVSLPVTALDLCSGSGCIGLAIAHSTGANVTLSDLSKKAIKIAQHNNDLNNAKRAENMLPPVNVNYIVSDMFNNINYKYNIIISNPPYIARHDLNMLEIEVRDFDPILALDGGKDGLDFYRQIAKEAHKHLEENGLLYLELGIEQSDKVVKLLEKNFTDIVVIDDYNHVQRFIKARKKSNVK